MKREEGTVLFGRKTIKFFVKRSGRRKTVSLFVDPVEGIFLRAPRRTSIKTLKKLIHSRAVWILNKQRLIKESFEKSPPKEFINGESFLYLGRRMRLKTIKNKRKSGVSVYGGRLKVNITERTNSKDYVKIVRDLLVNWYRKHANKIISKRVEVYSRKLGIKIPEVILANQTKRWGSCSKNGRIRFNWHIIMAPVSLIDYVVAHELCHLRFNNHSRDFWKLLGSIMPDYESRRECLRKEGSKFYF